jgi:hypothetical protein
MYWRNLLTCRLFDADATKRRRVFVTKPLADKRRAGYGWLAGKCNSTSQLNGHVFDAYEANEILGRAMAGGFW